MTGSIKIHYSCNAASPPYIDCWCTRWDESNYDVIFETYLDSGSRNLLFDNLSSVGEIYEYTNLMGWAVFKDRTFKSGNTLILEPTSTGLGNLRKEEKVVVKNISDTMISKDRFSVKLECKKITDWSDFV